AQQRRLTPISAHPERRHVFWAEALLLAPHRSTSGYARRSRLASAQNPLPRMYSYFGDTTLAVGKQLPLSDSSDEIQRCVFERWLKVIQTAGDPHHQNPAVPGKQSYHRRFVRQYPIAEPRAVARKFKGDLVESHAAQIGPVVCGNDGMSIEGQALRQSAPADQRDTGTPRLFQRQPQRL